MANIKREIAYQVSIKEILNNQYFVNSDSESNYILINNKKVSRVNIIAFITNIENKLITMDDGTSEIILRDFNEKIKENLTLGDLILVVGRLREYNSEKYVVPEIIKKKENKLWMELRKLEISNIVKEEPVIEKREFKINEETNFLNTIKDIINLGDKGDGVSLKNILEKINSEDAEENIKKLLKMGEIYEIRPGIFKIL